MAQACLGSVVINRTTLTKNQDYLMRVYSNRNSILTRQELNAKSRAEENINQTFEQLSNAFCPKNNYDAQIATVNLTADEINQVSKYKESEECLVKAIFDQTDYSKRIVGSLPLNLFTSNYGRVGKKSVFGNIIKLDYKGLNGQDISLPILVKTSKEVDDMTLKNEAIIGYHLNILRLSVPNFVYTLGVDKCSPAIVQDNGQVESFCDAVGGQPYVIIEKIENPLGFDDYVGNLNTKFIDFFNVFTQVIIALYHSQVLNFTHYDLHYQNVLLEPQTTNKQYRVQTPWGDKYMQYTHLAKIIDFGLGHIQNSKGVFYGQYNPYYNVFPDIDFLLYDVYKLLMFSLYQVSASNRTDDQKIEFFSEAWGLYKYFNPPAQDISELMNDINYGATNSFSLFTTENERKQMSFTNFIECYYNNFSEYLNLMATDYNPNVQEYVYDELAPNFDIWQQFANQNMVQNLNINSYRQALYLYNITRTNWSNSTLNNMVITNINKFVRDVWVNNMATQRYEQLQQDIITVGQQGQNILYEPGNLLNMLQSSPTNTLSNNHFGNIIL